MKYRSYLVKGRVQGVGFRYFVKSAALKNGIKGYVKNNNDGTVYAEAAADETRLVAFEAALRKGPALAKVTELVILEIPAFEKSSFEIER